MSRDRTSVAYNFLRGLQGKVFAVGELASETGWSETTVRTYISKKWKGFLFRIEAGSYRVEKFPYTLEQFQSLQAQTATSSVLQPAYDYDVTLSFAGEDREYVEAVASVLHQLGVRVFYDKYEQIDLWGKNLYEHLADVYRNRARYCVVFVSCHYAEKLWTNHERQSAQARAFENKLEYILPVRFDETEIPGMLPTTGYINAEKLEPKALGLMIAQKTGLDTELGEMLVFLREWLPDYSVELDGGDIRFVSDVEHYDGVFPTRLLVEMYREDMLESMFLMPAIVPY